MTAELEYLQVRWAAHLPFLTATALLTELLPIEGDLGEWREATRACRWRRSGGIVWSTVQR